MGWTFTTYKHSTVNYIFERTPPPSTGFKVFMVSYLFLIMVSWVYDTYSTVLSYLILRSHGASKCGSVWFGSNQPCSACIHTALSEMTNSTLLPIASFAYALV